MANINTNNQELSVTSEDFCALLDSCIENLLIIPSHLVLLYLIPHEFTKSGTVKILIPPVWPACYALVKN